MMYPFIEKLLRMLDDPETQHIASWSDDGKSIIIHDLRNFEGQVLSKHFPYGRSDSFCRQLNIYNFKRTSDARKQRQNPKSRVSTFEHPHFQRGRLDLIGLIRRNKPIRASRSKHTNNHHNVDHHPIDKDHSPFPTNRSSDYSVRLPSIHHLPNWNTYQSGSRPLPPSSSSQSDSHPHWPTVTSDHPSLLSLTTHRLLDHFHSQSHGPPVIRHQTYDPRTHHPYDDYPYSSSTPVSPTTQTYSSPTSTSYHHRRMISRDPHPSSATSSPSSSFDPPIATIVVHQKSTSSSSSTTTSTTNLPITTNTATNTTTTTPTDIHTIFSIDNLIN